MGNLLDLFVFKYSRTDFHELNLDWIISDMKTLAETLENFISLNAIKYADPIEWNISSQYEANTVVVDATTGIAYLSTKAVPGGVSITNTDYWTPIFDLSILYGDIKDAITTNNEGNSATASKAYTKNDWLWWKGDLYIAITDMPAGTALIENNNVRKCEVEKENQVIYNAADRSLSIHAYIDPNAPIPVSGDYHIYQPTREAIQILKV